MKHDIWDEWLAILANVDSLSNVEYPANILNKLKNRRYSIFSEEEKKIFIDILNNATCREANLKE